jgi:hypothetical protein
MISSKPIKNNKYLQHSKSVVHVAYILSPRMKKLTIFFFLRSNGDGGKELCFYKHRKLRFCRGFVMKPLF